MRQQKQRSNKFKKYRAIGRALGVVAAVVIIVSGVTFAALQSQQVKLTGNTIETATANLSLSTDSTHFGTTSAGFDFNSIIPGGPAVPSAGYAFYLKNGGSTALGLTMNVTSTPTNPNNVDLSKVNIILTPVGAGTGSQSFSLQSLIAGAVPINGNLPVNTAQQYKLQVSMDTDAVSGSSANLGSLDFSFSGTAVAN